MLIVLLPLCPPTLNAFCLHLIIITFTLNDELVICSLNVRIVNVIDVWRTLNPDGKGFTWQRTKPEVHCRPDYFMISSSLTTAITNAEILPGDKTDHSLITIHHASNSNPRGQGFWKLNTSFLLDSEYIELIKNTIDEVVKEYRNNDDVDTVLLWDTIKMQIRSSWLKYATEKKDKIKSKENTLESDICSLRKKLQEENLSDTVKRRGQITPVPKKNKPANLLKNWRPITRLNCDYKIAAKSITNCIKKVLPNIINNDQTGFLKKNYQGKYQARR